MPVPCVGTEVSNGEPTCGRGSFSTPPVSAQIPAGCPTIQF